MLRQCRADALERKYQPTASQREENETSVPAWMGKHSRTHRGAEAMAALKGNGCIIQVAADAAAERVVELTEAGGGGRAREVSGIRNVERQEGLEGVCHSVLAS